MPDVAVDGPFTDEERAEYDAWAQRMRRNGQEGESDA